MDRTIAAVLGRTRSAVKNRAITLGLKKSAEYMATGPGHFKAGGTSWNAGKSMPSTGRTAETQFKKGQRPHTWKPIGTERVSKDGYLERKISETGRRWRFVHLLVWEAVNGPLPKGHAVVFRDGNRQNISLDNLECISRAELMSRNTIHNLPPEIAAAKQLIGALNRQINKREKRTAA
ncbi:MAG: HNH endonuclease [unclassified Hahellaceae]|nr:HNH endonuclease [Hahellaceae bacterium]